MRVSYDDQASLPASAIDGAAARLRADIDCGRTGDKVDWPDPAAAPLGTDDEAGGNCSHSVIIERARYAEIGRIAIPSQREHGLGAAWVLILLMLMAASGMLLPLFV
jgi:hypothetical protein